MPKRRLGIILKCALNCIKFTWCRLHSFDLRQGPAACYFLTGYIKVSFNVGCKNFTHILFAEKLPSSKEELSPCELADVIEEADSNMSSHSDPNL
jgi:hypothetical protein